MGSKHTPAEELGKEITRPWRLGTQGPPSAAGLHHVPEEHMLGGNSSISEALPRTSDRETLICSEHCQSLGTASKLHRRVCQDKSTPLRERALEEPAPLLAPERLKSSSGSGPGSSDNGLQTGRTSQEKGKLDRRPWPLNPFAEGGSSGRRCRCCWIQGYFWTSEREEQQETEEGWGEEGREGKRTQICFIIA